MTGLEEPNQIQTESGPVSQRGDWMEEEESGLHPLDPFYGWENLSDPSMEQRFCEDLLLMPLNHVVGVPRARLRDRGVEEGREEHKLGGRDQRQASAKRPARTHTTNMKEKRVEGLTESNSTSMNLPCPAKPSPDRIALGQPPLRARSRHLDMTTTP